MPSATSAPTASASAFLATFASVLAAILVLLVVDTSLARIDRRESAMHAASQYAEGRTLLALGRPRDAAERFAAAFAMERHNRSYELALAQAVFEEGRLEDAEQRLKTLLTHAESDGAVNIAMARTLVREGRTSEAESYYHRAIYGRWRTDSVRQRTAARLELIDLLAARRDTHALLAELLPLEEVIPDSAPLRRRLGKLFVVAGSPARAANIFRALLRENPDDADAYAGMGEAALALGNFRTARSDYLEALRLQPGDSSIAARLALSDTVLALNPMNPRLDARARYVRSRDILARTIAAAESCHLLSRGALTDSAWRSLAAVTSEQDEAATDRFVSLAVDLYSSLPSACARRDAPNDEALALIQARLAP